MSYARRNRYNGKKTYYRQILETINQSTWQQLTREAIIKETNIEKTTCSHVLKNMIDDGSLIKERRGLFIVYSSKTNKK